METRANYVLIGAFTLAVIAAAFLNLTIFGRYLLALGRNEQAARYSGINTDNIVILAYAACSLLAGLGGVTCARRRSPTCRSPDVPLSPLDRSRG
jgi:ribose transport system permease protein